MGQRRGAWPEGEQRDSIIGRRAGGGDGSHRILTAGYDVTGSLCIAGIRFDDITDEAVGGQSCLPITRPQVQEALQKSGDRKHYPSYTRLDQGRRPGPR